MDVRIPRTGRRYAVLHDNYGVALVLSGADAQREQDPVTLLDAAGSEPRTVTDGDVLIYVAATELPSGDALARVADELELVAEGLEQELSAGDAELAAGNIVGRLVALDIALGEE